MVQSMPVPMRKPRKSSVSRQSVKTSLNFEPVGAP
jgi:hypothetical protein